MSRTSCGAMACQARPWGRAVLIVLAGSGRRRQGPALRFGPCGTAFRPPLTTTHCRSLWLLCCSASRGGGRSIDVVRRAQPLLSQPRAKGGSESRGVLRRWALLTHPTVAHVRCGAWPADEPLNWRWRATSSERWHRAFCDRRLPDPVTSRSPNRARRSVHGFGTPGRRSSSAPSACGMRRDSAS
jgi:hypothetical protein